MVKGKGRSLDIQGFRVNLWAVFSTHTNCPQIAHKITETYATIRNVQSAKSLSYQYSRNFKLPKIMRVHVPHPSSSMGKRTVYSNVLIRLTP